jgi:hypothetical protein
MDEMTAPAKTDKPERVLVVHDEAVLRQNDHEGRSYQEESGSMGLNQKGNDAGYRGFLSEQQGRIVITREQWDAHLASLGEEARGEVLRAAEFYFAHGPDGELDANVCMFVGAKLIGDLNGLHPTGYWTGDDVHDVHINSAETRHHHFRDHPPRQK